MSIIYILIIFLIILFIFKKYIYIYMSRQAKKASSSLPRQDTPTVINLLITTHGSLSNVQTYDSRSNTVNQNIFTTEETKRGLERIQTLTLNNIMVNETGECSRISREDMDVIIHSTEREYQKTGTIVNKDLLDILKDQQEEKKEENVQISRGAAETKSELYRKDMKIYQMEMDARQTQIEYNAKYPEHAFTLEEEPIKPKKLLQKKIRKGTYTFVMNNNITRFIDKMYDFDTGYDIPPFIIFCSNDSAKGIIERVIYSHSSSRSISLSSLIITILTVCDRLDIFNVVINILDTSCNNLSLRGNAVPDSNGVFHRVLKGGKKHRKTRKTRKTRKSRKTRKTRK
jgi:hypothetical protein